MKPTYSTDRKGRVLRGRVIVAWFIARRDGALRVVSPAGEYIGVASTPAEAMLMAARHEEAPR